MATVEQLPAVEPGAFQSSVEDNAFLKQVERHIALLGGQHFLRISLFRLKFVGMNAARIGASAQKALAAVGLVGLMPDGSLGLLYVGPRPSAQEDLSVEREVADKVNYALASVSTAVRLLSVTAAHRWADEIDGADDLIDEALFISATRQAPLRRAS